MFIKKSARGKGKKRCGKSYVSNVLNLKIRKKMREEKGQWLTEEKEGPHGSETH